MFLILSVALVGLERKSSVTKTLAKANAVRCRQPELLGIGVDQFQNGLLDAT